MEKKVIKEENNSGLYTKVETIEKKFDDGFVDQANFHPANGFHPSNLKSHKEYHKGAEKTVTITTNDPRITRPALKIICGFMLAVGLLFLLIGIISFSFSNILFGILFVFFGSFSYIKGKKDIDKIEEELRQNDKEYINTDPKEVQKKFIKDVENRWNDVKQSTFTKTNFKKFVKETIALYCIIAIITFLLISFLLNIVLGLVILVIFVLCGFIFYWIVSKICK